MYLSWFNLCLQNCLLFFFFFQCLRFQFYFLKAGEWKLSRVRRDGQSFSQRHQFHWLSSCNCTCLLKALSPNVVTFWLRTSTIERTQFSLYSRTYLHVVGVEGDRVIYVMFVLVMNRPFLKRM